MKFKLILLLLLTSNLAWSQLKDQLEGTWVKKSAEYYDAENSAPLDDFHIGYLRYEFPAKGKLKVYVSYFANGLEIDHQLKKRRLILSFGREFLIELVDENHLVLVESTNGKVGAQSVRYRFEREAFYLENLPIDPETRIRNDQGQQVYLDSEKLHPKYKHKRYPDFHIYVHNQIKKAYPNGANFLYVCYEVRPDATLGNVRVMHHANQESTDKVAEAITNYEGQWTLPLLNGEGVTVQMSMMDRFTKSKKGSQITVSTSGGISADGYSGAYINAYKKGVEAYFKDDSKGVFEMLTYCEQIRPYEPNIPYLKYLTYLKAGEIEKAAEQKELLKGTKLAFLVGK